MSTETHFTKIGADGQPLPADSKKKAVALLDERTGLMWDANDASKKKLAHADAMAAAAAVSTAGFSDWRAPTQLELESLRDLTLFGPAADPVLNLKTDWYWSSTPLASSPADCAWLVGFYYGGAYYHNRYHQAFVRPVRVARASQ